eukprot:11549033-Alexandrium_andersonii.AAC.1
MKIERSQGKAELEWGSYEPFEVIVKKEPGLAMTKASLEATLNICKACKQLGGSWARVDKFSKRE